MIKSLLLLLVVVVAGSLSTSCAGKEDAEKVANDLFQHIQSQDYQGTTGYMAPQFFQKTSSEQWVKDLTSINAKLGDLQTWKLTSWKINTTASTFGSSGTTYNFTYDAAYSKYPAKINLTLFKQSGSKDLPQVVGFNINSNGFLSGN